MQIVALDLSGYDALIDQVAKDLHSGKLKASDLNQELISKTYKNIAEGAGAGYGKNWVKFPADDKGSTPLELKKNIYAFSGAKTYAQLEALNQLLSDKDGKLRPFNEFAQLAKSINRQYNVNYLQAEYQTARTAAQMAEKWERIQETKHLFPNLKFRTVGDSRVRREHERLDGIIRPIDDDFWSRNYPPLDWRCRCDAVPTAEDETEYDEKQLPPVKFQGNVGKDKEIFTSKGTFFKLANTSEKATHNVELSKLNAPFEKIYTAKNGKRLDVNIQADPVDLADNIEVAKVIINELGVNVSIRPHINGWIVKGHPNPEYYINGKVGERKTPEGSNYGNVLSKANKQGCEVVVIDLSVNKETVDNALLKIDNVLRFDVHQNIRTVYILSADRKTVKEYKRKKRS